MNIESAVRTHLKTLPSYVTPEAIKFVLGGLNDSPIDSAAIIRTSGPGPDMDIPTELVTFQVMVRSAKYNVGLNLLERVKADLHATSFESEGIKFRSVFAIASGGPIGRNEKGAELFSVNFQANVINPLIREKMEA